MSLRVDPNSTRQRQQAFNNMISGRVETNDRWAIQVITERSLSGNKKVRT